MDFDKLLTMRRSIRRYQDTTVPKEILLDIIKDSTLAPSSGNEQPWKFIIVSDRKLLDEISNDCKKSLMLSISKDPQHPAKKYEAMLSNSEFNILYNAPSLVYIVGKKMKNTEINCTLAASYLMFSATNKGLGTCWINFAKYIGDEKIKEKLGLNQDLEIIAPIIIGYPEVIPDITKRKEIEMIKFIE